MQFAIYDTLPPPLTCRCDVVLRTATTSPPQPTDTMKERAKEGDEGRVQDADGLNDNLPLFRL